MLSHLLVIRAQAGNQETKHQRSAFWIPAFAGLTVNVGSLVLACGHSGIILCRRAPLSSLRSGLPNLMALIIDS